MSCLRHPNTEDTEDELPKPQSPKLFCVRCGNSEVKALYTLEKTKVSNAFCFKCNRVVPTTATTVSQVSRKKEYKESGKTKGAKVGSEDYEIFYPKSKNFVNR